MTEPEDLPGPVVPLTFNTQFGTILSQITLKGLVILKKYRNYIIAAGAAASVFVGYTLLNHQPAHEPAEEIPVAGQAKAVQKKSLGASRRQNFQVKSSYEQPLLSVPERKRAESSAVIGYKHYYPEATVISEGKTFLNNGRIRYSYLLELGSDMPKIVAHDTYVLDPQTDDESFVSHRAYKADRIVVQIKESDQMEALESLNALHGGKTIKNLGQGMNMYVVQFNESELDTVERMESVYAESSAVF